MLVRRRNLIRAIEHLKAAVNLTIDRFHEGSVDGVKAKLELWDEVQRTLAHLGGRAFNQVAQLRVQLPAQPDIVTLMLHHIRSWPVVATRYVGPRGEGQPAVAYLTVEVASAVDVAELVEHLAGATPPLFVRDWTFGCTP